MKKNLKTNFSSTIFLKITEMQNYRTKKKVFPFFRIISCTFLQIFRYDMRENPSRLRYFFKIFLDIFSFPFNKIDFDYTERHDETNLQKGIVINQQKSYKFIRRQEIRKIRNVKSSSSTIAYIF